MGGSWGMLKDIFTGQWSRDEDMFRVNDLDGDEVIVETEVANEVVVETKITSKDMNLSVDEVTLAQALATLKSVKLRLTKVGIRTRSREQSTFTNTN
ncbi:hypothetical protein Tco_1410876 [Tanacetum coccineum]